jgi:hypothetical protein
MPEALNTTPEEAKVPPKRKSNGGDNGPGNGSEGNGATSPERPWLQVLLFLIIALIFCIVLYKGVIGDKNVLESISDAKTARGMITFLFAVGTIGIALLVCMGALIGRGDKAKESFYRAKEILTILVGILGTIVGFYFGAVTEEGQVELTVAKPILSLSEVKGRQPVSLTTFVSGGKKPYRYMITFPDFKDKKIEGLAEDTGWIRKEFQAPTVSEAQKVVYTLDVEDAGGAKGHYTCDAVNGLVVAP